jgi:hypothetical protein
MANKILGAPVEVTRMTFNAATDSSRFALGIGRNLVQRAAPGYIPPDILAQQQMLRLFKHRAFVAGNLIDPEISKRKLKSNVSSVVEATVDKGLAGKDTTIEVRPVLPWDAYFDPDVSERSREVTELLEQGLKDNGVERVIANAHPIMPSMPLERREVVSTIPTWPAALAAELDGLSLQAHQEPIDRLAMLAFSGVPHSIRMFGGQSVKDDRLDHLVHNRLLALGHVGTWPEETLLIPVR